MKIITTLLIEILNTNTKVPRSFPISEPFYAISKNNREEIIDPLIRIQLIVDPSIIINDQNDKCN